MSLDKLNSYKLDSAYKDGVVINLDDAPDVDFLVKLPGPYNRPYMAALYGSMNMGLNKDGELDAKVNIVQTRQAQEDAFLAYCLISIDGQPAPDNFAEDYPKAIEELINKSNELVERISNRVEHASKKLQPTLTGSTVGAVG